MRSGSGRSRTLHGVACLVLLAALSGCMQLNIGLTVKADDTVSGQLLLTAERKILTWNNQTVEQGFADLRQNIPALPPGPETPYATDTHFGFQINYRNVPLDQFDSESLRIVRANDRYVFTLPLDPNKYGGKVAEQDPENQARFMSLMSFEIAVTFPGRVLDVNAGGQVNDRTVTWRVNPNEPKPAELRAVAEAPPRPSAAADTDATGGLPWLLIAAGAVVLLLGALLVVLLLRRRRATGDSTTATATDRSGAGEVTTATDGGGAGDATTAVEPTDGAPAATPAAPRTTIPGPPGAG
ncbi:LppM family (lipo)protein [Micromonospora sp. DT229]|uniref:LppM family (lipo)protein n=1 Tax=Micromonospora sp. DT229 TaxID=3393430 RepID=UPI003CFAE656